MSWDLWLEPYDRVSQLEQQEMELEREKREDVPSASFRKPPMAVVLVAITLLVGLLACLMTSHRGTKFLQTHSESGDLISKATEMTPAEKMIEKYQGLITELDVKVLQCQEGIARLQSLKNPYIINAMLTAVGPVADGCSLVDYDVHKSAPANKTEVCVIHCGEEDCPASLSFMQDNKEVMKKNCGSIIYLQGGAKCFVEQGMLQKNSEVCAGIVEPHAAGEFQSLAKKLNIKQAECNSSLMVTEKPYIVNMMISALGERADACSFSDKVVHATAPAESHESCVIFCGETHCPFALSFLQKNEAVMSKNCGSIVFLQGGARCFLEANVPVKNKDQCSELVIG
mmetsp:Transcript_138988/g.255609  ORF Transcript_138988/g.255609 Transcript_138988/m.255609 type:complete len:342 (+) Transcript_138988:1-1026(+)